MLFVTGVYAYSKLLVFLDKKDTNILTSQKDNYFEAEDIFGYEKGMNIAVAVTEYNKVREMELERSYGEIIFNTYRWGEGADGAPFVSLDPIESHVCSAEELNVDGDS